MGRLEKRTGPDRRRRSTPIISRYTFRGQRRNIRRKGDLGKEKYVDRYSPRWLFLLILLFCFNGLDCFFTWTILRNGGHELNPIVAWLINIWGGNFWICKLGVVFTGSLVMGFLSQFGIVKIAIFLLCSLYLGLVSYEFSLFIHFLYGWG
jgi:Domain of unknown function (DUF5658)